MLRQQIDSGHPRKGSPHPAGSRGPQPLSRLVQRVRLAPPGRGALDRQVRPGRPPVRHRDAAVPDDELHEEALPARKTERRFPQRGGTARGESAEAARLRRSEGLRPRGRGERGSCLRALPGLRAARERPARAPRMARAARPQSPRTTRPPAQQARRRAPRCSARAPAVRLIARAPGAAAVPARPEDQTRLLLPPRRGSSRAPGPAGRPSGAPAPPPRRPCR